MINANNISFQYMDDTINDDVLKNVDITIKKGEFVAILGHNGSGKSTLAKHFNAILTPTEGTVYVDNMDTKNDANLWDIRKKVAMVFQNPDNQIVATIVEDDVAFGPENLGYQPSVIREKVDNALASVDMLKLKNHAPHMLSGGQKQRVAIAGVIAISPDIIVLDEPTAMLDPKGRREVMDVICRLNREYNITVVLITHNMEEAVLSDRVVVINDGEIVTDDVPKNVFSNVEKMKELGLDVPQVTELAYNLRKNGVDIPSDILDEQQCVKELLKICKLK